MIHIKLMNGDLLSLEGEAMSHQQLHDAVWDKLPHDLQPPREERWRIMLFLDGVWQAADDSPVPVGAVVDILYDLFLVQGQWLVDFPINAMCGGIWSTSILVDGPSGHTELRHYFDEDTGLFYRFEDVVEWQVREGAQPVDGRTLLAELELPPPVAEVFYAHWFRCYLDILPLCPRPLPYYSPYRILQDDGHTLILTGAPTRAPTRDPIQAIEAYEDVDDLEYGYH
jgi:hypothetical protein